MSNQMFELQRQELATTLGIDIVSVDEVMGELMFQVHDLNAAEKINKLLTEQKSIESSSIESEGDYFFVFGTYA